MSPPRLISSRITYVYKRVIPIAFLAFLVVFVAMGLFASDGPHTFVLLAPVFALLGYWYLKHSVFDLVDEVWDEGDALLIRNRGEEFRIAISDIEAVSPPSLLRMYPLRVVLSLRGGHHAAYCARHRLTSVASDPTVIDLMARVAAVKRT